MPGAALAELTPEQQAQIDQLPLERICSTTGSLGLRFGATDHGLSPDEYGTVERELDASFAPFTKAVLRFSQTTGRFTYVRLAAPLDEWGDLRETALRIGERFREAGWHNAPTLFFSYFGDGSIRYDEGPLSPEVRLYSAELMTADQPMTTGEPVVSMATQGYGAELGLFCQSILEDMWNNVEQTQAPPIELAMPPLPEPLPESRYTENDCGNPAKREEILSELGAMAGLSTAVDASEAVIDWKRALILASGKATRAELDAGLQPLQSRYREDTRGLQPDWSALAYFWVTSQPREHCETALQITHASNAQVVAASKGLTAMHQFLNTEAARLGVAVEGPK